MIMKTQISKVFSAGLLATGIAVMLVAAPAEAKPAAKPSNGGSGETTNSLQKCNVLDISGAVACAGAFSGNDSQGSAWSTQLNTNNIFGDYNWTFGSKIDSPATNWKTSEYFKIQNNVSTGNIGTIELLKDIDSAFALTLKTSTGWSAYKFEGGSVGDIFNWNTIGVALDGSGTKGKALSHASLYISDYKIPQDDNQEVPEPATLLGLAALGGVFMTKKVARKS
ncbi:MAG: PEP-CTERM sorting domain-containing protein [Microcoleaceae cyanobacterium]